MQLYWLKVFEIFKQLFIITKTNRFQLMTALQDLGA